jgi:hypothetical protein
MLMQDTIDTDNGTSVAFAGLDPLREYLTPMRNFHSQSRRSLREIVQEKQVQLWRDYAHCILAILLDTHIDRCDARIYYQKSGQKPGGSFNLPLLEIILYM